MTAITYDGNVPTVAADEDTWGAELNTGLTQIKADLDMLNAATANSLLGRNEGTSGAVERLTAAEAAAMLPAVVGDSGAGGTKGLVPAPAAGDAAAEKYLNADGTWGVPQPFAWALINGTTGALIAGYNVASTSRVALGTYRLTFTRAAGSANYGFGGTAYAPTKFFICTGVDVATTYCDIATMRATVTPSLAIEDCDQVTIWAFQ